MSKHLPVMLNEVIDGLMIQEHGTYVDLTLGRAGHSEVILSKLKKGLLIGFDQDCTAIEESRVRLNQQKKSFTLIHSNFSNVKAELEKINIHAVDGVLMDLGVSSPQFDDGERGFSYRYDARLDMRMDQRQSLSAHEIVNTYDLRELTKIMREYGDEKYAYEIAKNIVKTREKHPIDTTFELVDVIKASLPKKELLKKGHPAKQVFQALRISTNNEYEVLKQAVEDVLSILNKGGRLVIITFHSGEDRIIKHIFKEKCVIEGSRRGVIVRPEDEEKPKYAVVNKNVITASEEELKNNPRSESAKLRIIEKL